MPLGLQVGLGQRELPVLPVLQEPLVLQAGLAQQDPRVVRGRLVRLELQVRDRLVLLGQLVRLEQLVQLGQLVLLVQVPLDPQVPRVPQVPPVQLGLRDPQALLELQELQAGLVQLGLQDQLAFPQKDFLFGFTKRQKRLA